MTDVKHAYTPTWRAGSFTGNKAVEQSIVAKVNALRRKLGLKPITVDKRLTVAARQHTQEMIARNYFSHYSPIATFRMPWRRACLAGYIDRSVSENIAQVGNPTDPAATLFTSWVSSPRHYANMTKRGAIHIGMGVASVMRKGMKVYFATQMFGASSLAVRNLVLRKNSRGRWVLRGEALARTSNAAGARFFLGGNWGSHLSLKVGRWKRFSQALSGKITSFSLALRDGTIKKYLKLNPGSVSNPFTCP